MARVDEDQRPADRAVSDSEIQATAEHLAQSFPEIQAIWLFGSHARGEQRRNSEVDLAVMTALELREDAGQRDQLSAAASQFLSKPVPVEPMGYYLTPERTFEILGLPKLLLARDAEAAAIFASKLRSYARGELEWQESRSRRSYA